MNEPKRTRYCFYCWHGGCDSCTGCDCKHGEPPIVTYLREQNIPTEEIRVVVP